MTPLYLLGAGGHAKVVLSTALEAGWTVAGLFDDDPHKQGTTVLGIPVLGTLDQAQALQATGVIALGDNRLRQRLARRFAHWQWATLVHPRAYVHPSVHLGPGTVVFAGAVIQPDTRIGAHCIINTGATVDHDCLLEDFVHIAPGAHLAGGVRVGQGCLIGVGAAVLPGASLGPWSVLGAGAVLRHSLESFTIAVGVPARPLRKEVP